MAKKRKVIQFFINGDDSLVLCDTGEVFAFRYEFATKDGKKQNRIVWYRRAELENVVIEEKE